MKMSQMFKTTLAAAMIMALAVTAAKVVLNICDIFITLTS